MPAWQPVQLPQDITGSSRNWGELGELFIRAAQMRRQRDQDDAAKHQQLWERQRQQAQDKVHQDYSGALVKQMDETSRRNKTIQEREDAKFELQLRKDALEALESGGPGAAEAIVGAYGFKRDPAQAQPQAPQAQPQPIQGGSAMPDGIENATSPPASAAHRLSQAGGWSVRPPGEKGPDGLYDWDRKEDAEWAEATETTEALRRQRWAAMSPAERHRAAQQETMAKALRGDPTETMDRSTPEDREFRRWYADVAGKLGLAPSPNDPGHQYDYRALYRDILAGNAAPLSTEGHIPGAYKGPGSSPTVQRITPDMTQGLDDVAQPMPGTQPQGQPQGQGPIRFIGPNGRVITLDPGEAQRAEIQRRQMRAQRFEEAYAGANIPDQMRKHIPGVKSAILSGAVKEGAELDRLYEAMKMENDHMEGMRPRSGGGLLDTLLKEARLGNMNRDNIRGDMATWGTAYERWEKNANVDTLTDAYDKFQQMRTDEANSRINGDVIGQRSALYQAARLITGPGVLTAQEYQNTVSRTGGLISSALTKLSRGLDGTISDQEAAALEKFIENSNVAIRNKAIQRVRNFDTRFGNGYYANNVPDEVQASRDALMHRFGISEDEVQASPIGTARRKDAEGATRLKNGGKVPADSWNEAEALKEFRRKQEQEQEKLKSKAP